MLTGRRGSYVADSRTVVARTASIGNPRRVPVRILPSHVQNPRVKEPKGALAASLTYVLVLTIFEQEPI